MSDMAPNNIIKRIETAAEASPIAVFESNVSMKLNAVFAATAVSFAEIEQGENAFGKKLIGVFDRTCNISDVTKELKAHVKQDDNIKQAA